LVATPSETGRRIGEGETQPRPELATFVTTEHFALLRSVVGMLVAE
jgi:hypothetical protein